MHLSPNQRGQPAVEQGVRNFWAEVERLLHERQGIRKQEVAEACATFEKELDRRLAKTGQSGREPQTSDAIYHMTPAHAAEVIMTFWKRWQTEGPDGLSFDERPADDVECALQLPTSPDDAHVQSTW